MPQMCCLGFVLREKVDADHAVDTVTRRPRTRFMVYLNIVPIYWSTKKQKSVESGYFGSEFSAMKQFSEYLLGLCYKLRMMSISCDVSEYIFGDNKSVLCNTYIPDSTLKKKSQIIAYHLVCKGTSRDEWKTLYTNIHNN